jgi:hypothetical protein
LTRAGGRGGGARERGERGLVVIDGDNLRALGEPQRERADAREQIGDARGAAAKIKDQPRQPPRVRRWFPGPPAHCSS